jgi:hypothetical protein
MAARKSFNLKPASFPARRPILSNYRNSIVLWRVLYWIAKEGMSTYGDIALKMGLDISTSKAKNIALIKVQRACAVLKEENLIMLNKLKMYYGLKLHAIRVTDFGKAHCAKNYGWEKCITDWEKLVAFHNGTNCENHSAAVLNFAYHARLRNWIVRVLPEEDSTPSNPDMLIYKDGNYHYVEVETRGNRAVTKTRKWLNQYQIQKGVAVCMMTNEAAWNVAQMFEENYYLDYHVTSLMFLQSTAYNNARPGNLWLAKMENPYAAH